MSRHEIGGKALGTVPAFLIGLAMSFLALVAVGWTGTPSAEAQGSAPVTVVNTPLPVSLSGTNGQCSMTLSGYLIDTTPVFPTQ